MNARNGMQPVHPGEILRAPASTPARPHRSNVVHPGEIRVSPRGEPIP